MPYLQLDVPERYPPEVKRNLARRLGETYGRIMETSADRVTVAIRELPDGSLWHCSSEEPEPGAMLMCDIRQGRPAEQRAELALALIDACVEILGLRRDQLPVDFTQHSGTEMFRASRGWSRDWTADEADG